MSVFGSIMSAIFGGQAAGIQSAQPPTAPSAPASSAGPAGTLGAGNNVQGGGANPSAASSGTAPASGGGSGSVDVAALLEQRASEKDEELDWRHSIVDLMKVLDLDSSLSARKALAQELHYTGNTNDSAAMNTWLHRQVMQKLAENGGTVPQELRP